MSPPPIVVATLQSAVINAISNVVAQAITAHNQGTSLNINWIPVFQFFVFACVCTPPNFVWQDFLESSFPAYQTDPTPSTKAPAEKGRETADRKRKLNKRNTLAKTLLDQTLGATINTLLFSAFMHGIRAAMAHHEGDSGLGFLLSGNGAVRYDKVDWAAVWARAREEFWPILTAGWRFWPFVSLVNFCFLTTVEARNLVGSLAGLGWGVFVSLFAGK